MTQSSDVFEPTRPTPTTARRPSPSPADTSPLLRAHTARVVRDLERYLAHFDRIDAEAASLEPDQGERMRALSMEQHGPEMLATIDLHLAALETVDGRLAPESRVAARSYFRERVWKYLQRSEFHARTVLKPRGYAGDSVLMQWIYDAERVGDSTFGMLLHGHVVGVEAAQAVRNRRRKIAAEVRSSSAALTGRMSRPFEILSVACGPAWELRDLFQQREDAARYSLTLLDQDPQALSEARSAVEGAARAIDGEIHARYLCESVKTKRTAAELAEVWGRFDFIYSMGLFDYLTEKTAKGLLSTLYGQLQPGGRMIIGNYHVGCATRLYLDYWMDWPLVYRTESQLFALAGGLPSARTNISFETTRSQMYLEISKPVEAT